MSERIPGFLAEAAAWIAACAMLCALLASLVERPRAGDVRARAQAIATVALLLHGVLAASIATIALALAWSGIAARELLLRRRARAMRLVRAETSSADRRPEPCDGARLGVAASSEHARAARPSSSRSRPNGLRIVRGGP